MIQASSRLTISKHTLGTSSLRERILKVRAELSGTIAIKFTEVTNVPDPGLGYNLEEVTENDEVRPETETSI